MTLVDTVATAGVAAVLTSAAIPLFHASREDRAARIAARYIATRFHHARFEALKRNAIVAVRFDPDDLDRFGLYVDGDGDGVLQSDINRGIDTLIGRESRLSEYASDVGLRINQEIVEPESGVRLAEGSDAFRFGISTIVSFSPLGGATSGTMYVAGSHGPQMAVRVSGASGRMRVLRFDPANRRWRES